MRGPHIHDTELALAATGDLGWRRRLAVWVHARQCAECAAGVEEFRALRAEVRRTGDTGVEDAGWAELEREMKANIRLGLAAGRIVDPKPVLAIPGMEPAGWRAAVVMATLTVVLASGWLLKRPVPQQVAPVPASMVAEASAEGVGFHEGQTGLVLLGPERDTSVMLAGSAGGARARFIDEETGQVTIHHVALED